MPASIIKKCSGQTPCPHPPLPNSSTGGKALDAASSGRPAGGSFGWGEPQAGGRCTRSAAPCERLAREVRFRDRTGRKLSEEISLKILRSLVGEVSLATPRQIFWPVIFFTTNYLEVFLRRAHWIVAQSPDHSFFSLATAADGGTCCRFEEPASRRGFPSTPRRSYSLRESPGSPLISVAASCISTNTIANKNCCTYCSCSMLFHLLTKRRRLCFLFSVYFSFCPRRIRSQQGHSTTAGQEVISLRARLQVQAFRRLFLLPFFADW